MCLYRNPLELSICVDSMLSELSTSKLSPHKYYELSIRAFDELKKLESFFRDETWRGCSIAELYELVQHAGACDLQKSSHHKWELWIFFAGY
ncbi:unnamed protein product [Thlaspi arvense]|uniref:Uncharacterized protein n=1 Tax=Thlaspi arvense TaxID=13288 RepID=A0AAU9RY94_THLAR|nr:unnamed protein product [Thlaspi arvense]